MIYLLLLFLIVYILFILFILLLKNKINKFEKKIIYMFEIKNNQIPSIYEISKKYLNRHEDIFKDIIYLKKINFSENSFCRTLLERTYNYKRIHNEMNFIFKVCNKNWKINKDFKYLYEKEKIINISHNIWKNIEIYKNIIKKYNKYITIKNITVIWLLIPIYKKESI